MAYKHTDQIQLDEEYQNVETYKKLDQSRTEGKILRTQIVGVVPNTTPGITHASQKYYALGAFEGYQVLIPGSLMGLDIENAVDKAGNPVSENNKAKMYQAYIRAMIGAEIDFVVYKDERSINAANKMVVGDRITAMQKKRQSNFFKSDKDGKSKVERAFEAGESVIARVISIAKSIVIVEVYGYVAKIIAKEVSWRYTEDLRDVVYIGEQLHVKFLTLDIDKENKTINATLSIKAAQPNVMRENMKKYRKDSILKGKVSGVKDGGYFVQIGDHISGIDVYCRKINCIDLPREGDIVSVRLYTFDEEHARVFGSIEAVIEKKYRNFAA